MTDKPNKVGRPARILSPEEIAQVEGLASVLSQDQMADYFMISRPTFTDIMDRQEGISFLYKRGRAKAIGAVAHGLLQRARDGDTASAIFYLKTQAGWRETTVTEHTGKDGGAIKLQTLDPTKLSADTLRELLASRNATPDPDES